MPDVLYPSGYGTSMVTLSQLKARHLNHMHPVFAERLFAWLEAQGGKVGIGGGFRETQPVKPGFAPAGKSFHQEQTFRSGFKGYCAVDLVHVNGSNVHRAPTWAEVPPQGSKDAAKWQVHCNVTGESWHMQPIEIDGYDSWVRAGRPDPVAAPAPPVVVVEPAKPETPAVITTPPLPQFIDPEDDMLKILVRCPDNTMLITDRFSYAHVVVNEPVEPEHLRDTVGASCRPDGSPWPVGSVEATYLKRIAT